MPSDTPVQKVNRGFRKPRDIIQSSHEALKKQRSAFSFSFSLNDGERREPKGLPYGASDGEFLDRKRMITLKEVRILVYNMIKS